MGGGQGHVVMERSKQLSGYSFFSRVRTHVELFAMATAGMRKKRLERSDVVQDKL